MIRWKYALPRLLVLGVVGLIVWLGLAPAVRWMLVSSGQTVLQAKVDIGGVRTSLLGGELELTGVKLVDTTSPEENFIQADQLILTLDADAALRRKLVVRQARAKGVTISGRLDARSTAAPRLGDLFPGEELTELGRVWLDQFADAMGDRLEDEVHQLESVQLIEELLRRWPAEYDQMEGRLDALRARAEGIHRLFQARSGNLLDDIAAYQQAMREVDEILREIDAIHAAVARLPQQAQRDREALAAAQRRDLESIRRRLELARLDGQTVSEYLLGPELAEQVAGLADWLAWARQYAPQETEAPPAPTRASGIDVLFPGVKQRPDFLIHVLALDGKAEIGGRQFQLDGEVRNLTSHPSLLGKPLELRMELRGPATFRIQAEFDRTGETPRDHIVFDCPDIQIGDQLLGRRDQLALAVSPGLTHVWASLDVVGDQLEGRIVLRQESVQLVPQVADRLGGERVAARLQTVAGQIKSIQVSLVVSGPMEQPDWKFESNLGPQLVDGLNLMVQRELEARGQELTDQVFRRVDAQFVQFEQLIRERRDAVLAKIDIGAAEFEELSRMIVGRLRMAPADEFLSRQLPSQIRLRF